MNTSKIIKGVVGGSRYTVTAPIMKEDYGLYLQIEGCELPSTYEVDFSNDEHCGTSVTMIGDENGVLIPSQFISDGKDVFAFYYHIGADYGRTTYKFRIPNKCRPDRTNEEPTPEEQSTIDQAIAALNAAVEQTGQDVQSTSESARSAQEDADFLRNASATVTTLDAGSEATVNLTDGEFAFGIPRGESYADVRFSDNVGYVPVDSNGIITKNTTISIDVRPMYGLDRMYSTNISGFGTLAAFKDGKVYAIQPRIFTESQYGITSFTYAFEEGYELKSMLYPMNLTITAKTSNIPSKSQTLTFSKKFTIVVDKQGVKGDTGDTGPQGIQGEIGPQGPSGEDAVSIQIDTDAVVIHTGADGVFTKNEIVKIHTAFYDGKTLKSTVPQPSKIKLKKNAGGFPPQYIYVDKNADVSYGVEHDVTWTFNSGWELYTNPTIIELKFIYNGVTYIEKIPLIVVKDGAKGIKGDKGDTGDDYVLTQADKEEIAGMVEVPSDYLKAFPTDTASGAVANFSDGADGLLLKSLVVSIEPKQEGTGDPSPDNVRPISGHTQAVVTRTGVNVWDEEWEVGGYAGSTGGAWDTNTRIRSKTTNYISVFPGTNYYAYMPSVTGMYLDIMFYDADKAFVSSTSATANNRTFTTPNNARFMRFASSVAYGTTYNHDISINYPSTDHDYHEGHVQSITIALGQTVYGGTLDVTNGVLTVDRAMVDMGTLTWASNGTDSVYTPMLKNKLIGGDNCVCSALAKVSQGTQVGSMSDATFKTYDNSADVSVKLSGITNQNAQTMLSGFQFVYPLATPITVTLTPNELSTLLGANNIWSDAGEVTAEYRADPTLFIQRKIAEALS